MNKRLRNVIFTGLLVAIGILLSQLLSFSYPPSSTIIKFGIGFVPLILVSIFFGPVFGLFAAVAQDVLGWAMLGTSQGVFYFGFTFNAILYGVLPGLIYRLGKKAKGRIFFFLNILFDVALIGVGSYYLFHIEDISGNTSFLPVYRYVLVALAIVSALVLLFISIWNDKKNKQNNLFHLIFFIVTWMYVLVSVVLTPVWIYDMYAVPILAMIPLRIVKMPLEVLIYTVILEILVRVLEPELNPNL